MVKRQEVLDVERLKAIESRVAAATKGPWISTIEGRDHFSGSSFIRTAGEDIEMSGATVADFDFIANAREDIPFLLDQIARLVEIKGSKGAE